MASISGRPSIFMVYLGVAGLMTALHINYGESGSREVLTPDPHTTGRTGP